MCGSIHTLLLVHGTLSRDLPNSTLRISFSLLHDLE